MQDSPKEAYNLTNLPMGCKIAILLSYKWQANNSPAWLPPPLPRNTLRSEMLIGTPRDRLDLRTPLLDRVLQELSRLGPAGLQPDIPLPPLLLSKPLLVFRGAPGGTPMASARREQGVCTQDA